MLPYLHRRPKQTRIRTATSHSTEAFERKPAPESTEVRSSSGLKIRSRLVGSPSRIMFTRMPDTDLERSTILILRRVAGSVGTWKLRHFRLEFTFLDWSISYKVLVQLVTCSTLCYNIGENASRISGLSTSPPTARQELSMCIRD